MDFAYSPHREPGATLLLPSPTHHAYGLDHPNFHSSLQQLRRSLSRSPSKPSRFHLRTGKTDASPISPLALNRAFSPKALKPTSPIAAYTESQSASATKKNKFTVRRGGNDRFRSSPRNRASTTQKSPRRALVESVDRGNASPFVSRSLFGEENMAVRKSSSEFWEQEDSAEFEIDDQPIKFEFSRSQPANSTTTTQPLFAPSNPSPLKRRDGGADFESTSGETPNPKRRSLHGLPTDFNIFEQSPAPRQSIFAQTPAQQNIFAQSPAQQNIFSQTPAQQNIFSQTPAQQNIFSQTPAPQQSIFEQTPAPRQSLFEESSPAPRQRIFEQTPAPRKSIFDQTPAPRNDSQQEESPLNLFSTPAANVSSPIRRNSSLRRSFSQRKPATDGEFMRPGLAASKTRPQRSSLDGFSFSTPAPAGSIFGQSAQQSRGAAGPQSRHPLSHTVSASSASSVVDDSPVPLRIPPTPGPGPRNPFAKSLPLGAERPKLLGEGPFDTPLPIRVLESNHLAKSTGGLLSKKSRDVESPKGDTYQLPETPSKRHSFPPPSGAESPLAHSFRTSFKDRIQEQQQTVFGTPSSQNSKISLGSLFGNNSGTTQRRGSHVSFDGLDDDCAVSPTMNRMADSQSSVDELPPTPTKNGDSYGRRSGRSSLRRSTFRGPSGRNTIGVDTFTAPNISTTPTQDVPAYRHSISGATPHTPSEPSFMPDASRLNISGQRPGALRLNSSFGSDCNNSFPPMTPTTPRDHSHLFGQGRPAIPIGLPKNDVDESLAARFADVQKLEGARGEFSTMYKVSRPLDQSNQSTPAGSWFSVVKKSKKPITGPLDRKKKLQEVEALRALRGNDHIVAYKNHWEHQQHLYIEAEYCDNGNLKDFLTKGRLDDFRIWKILLDLSLGLKFIHDSNFIHLDLKPANILIDFGGWLKIADFGLASAWPAPKHIDGEGDRSYLAPEALQGRFDKPADVFALGIILAEVAGDCQIPEFGEPWQKLRSGDFTAVLPSLSWSTQSTLSRDDNGDPIESAAQAVLDANGLLSQEWQEQVAKAPSFMTNDCDPWAMDQMVKAMLNPDPNVRPTAEDMSLTFGCQWVAARRSAGATVFEGNFGPSEETAYAGEPMITDNGDAMDMS